MKTKEQVWRYPSKISLLKDLREGYPGVGYLGYERHCGGQIVKEPEQLTAVIEQLM
jgi:hypothetical protein